MKTFEPVFLKDNYRDGQPCLSLSEISGTAMIDAYETFEAAREALFEFGDVEGYTTAIRIVEDGNVLNTTFEVDPEYKVEMFDKIGHSLGVVYFINEKDALSYAETESNCFYRVIVYVRNMYGKYIESHEYTNTYHTKY